MDLLATLCPKCGAPGDLRPRGPCFACGEESPPESWIRLPYDSIPPVPGVGHLDPRVCPRCESAIRWSPGWGDTPPPVVRILLFGGLGLLFSSGGLGLFETPASAWPLAAVGLTGVVLWPFLRYDGARFVAEGVVACRRCGYLPIGRHERERDARARDRAVSLLRWFLVLLALPFAFFVGTGAYRAWRGADLRAIGGPLVGFGLPLALAFLLLRVYRPRLRRARNPLREPRAGWETDWRRRTGRPRR